MFPRPCCLFIFTLSLQTRRVCREGCREELAWRRGGSAWTTLKVPKRSSDLWPLGSRENIGNIWNPGYEPRPGVFHPSVLVWVHVVSLEPQPWSSWSCPGSPGGPSEPSVLRWSWLGGVTPGHLNVLWDPFNLRLVLAFCCYVTLLLFFIQYLSSPLSYRVTRLPYPWNDWF